MCDGLNGAGWKDSTIPKTGWTCIDIVDSKDGESGKPFEACEMSGTSIRYVHLMDHPDYPDIKRVGCICAGHMEGNSVGARRRTWLWKTSQRGNSYIVINGLCIVVYPWSEGWKVRIGDRKGSLVHLTEDAAKLSAFDWINQA